MRLARSERVHGRKIQGLGTRCPKDSSSLGGGRAMKRIAAHFKRKSRHTAAAAYWIPVHRSASLHPTSSHFIHPDFLSLHRWWFKSSSLQLRWDHSMALHVLRAAFHQETSRSWQSTCSFHPWFWQFFACAYAGYLSTAISRGFVARSRCMDSIS